MKQILEEVVSTWVRMPGKVKVRVVAGRGLPVMDRSADTTDAFAEVCFLMLSTILSVAHI